MRDSDSIVERVAGIKRSLEELKTAQFTSQDSGMKFIQMDTISNTLTLTPPSNWENLALFKHEFTPEHDFPTLLVPQLNISAENVTMNVAEDTDNSYHRIISFYNGSTYAGYADLFAFYHEQTTGSKTRELISVMYYWFDSTQVSTIPFTYDFSLRATDSGVISQSGEIIVL